MRQSQRGNPLLDLAQGRVGVRPKSKPGVYRDYTGSNNEEKFPLHPCLDPACSHLVRAKSRTYCYPCRDRMESSGGEA